jgi:hypothetical protein
MWRIKHLAIFAPLLGLAGCATATPIFDQDGQPAMLTWKIHGAAAGVAQAFDVT